MLTRRYLTLNGPPPSSFPWDMAMSEVMAIVVDGKMSLDNQEGQAIFVLNIALNYGAHF